MLPVSRVNLIRVFCLFFLFTAPACRSRRPPIVELPRPAPTTETQPGPDGPMPTVVISASPNTIARGEETTLNWESTNATSLVIDMGVGNVAENGSLVVLPRESTTYTATATGPAGDTSSSTRVTVVPRSAQGIIRSTDMERLQLAIEEGEVQPLLFDYDQAVITSQGERLLEENARWFRQYPDATITIEGHCDERGTEEYNLALGDRRAQTVKAYLVQLGIDPDRMETISFGEERPFVQGYVESAYRLNRRAHFVVRR